MKHMKSMKADPRQLSCISRRSSPSRIPREVGHRNARVDGPELGLFGRRLFACQFEHFRRPGPGNEADAGIVGEDDVAGRDAHAPDFGLSFLKNRSRQIHWSTKFLLAELTEVDVLLSADHGSERTHFICAHIVR